MGDHRRVEGFLGVIGTIVELTAGDVKLEQQFAIAGEGWAPEWEREPCSVATGERSTHTTRSSIGSKTVGSRMWMIGAGPAGSESFFE